MAFENTGNKVEGSEMLDVTKTVHSIIYNNKKCPSDKQRQINKLTNIQCSGFSFKQPCDPVVFSSEETVITSQELQGHGSGAGELGPGSECRSGPQECGLCCRPTAV